MNDCRLADTHFHLDLFENIPELVREIEKKQIYTIAVTNSPTVFEHTYNICKGKKFIRPAVGLHPELVLQRFKEVILLKQHIHKTKYVGEIGLDYKDLTKKEKKLQRNVFDEILNYCSQNEPKILTVHSRGAEKDVIEMIGNHYPGKIILHWYSGNLSLLENAVEKGFYFSVNSQMLKSKKGRQIFKKIPSNRILTESDGPFAKLNGSISTPLNINVTVEKMSDLLSQSFEKTKKMLYQNFRKLLTNKVI